MQNGDKDIIQIPKKFIWKLAGNGIPSSFQSGVQILWQTTHLTKKSQKN